VATTTAGLRDTGTQGHSGPLRAIQGHAGEMEPQEVRGDGRGRGRGGAGVTGRDRGRGDCHVNGKEALGLGFAQSD
jgi:hypothetical protein